MKGDFFQYHRYLCVIFIAAEPADVEQTESNQPVPAPAAAAATAVATDTTGNSEQPDVSKRSWKDESWPQLAYFYFNRNLRMQCN